MPAYTADKLMRRFLVPLMTTFVISGCSDSVKKKPNMVFILVDQWRASATGYAGDPNVHTPYLDRFAQEATRFTNAVSVCPVCTPCRASLLTGRYPTSTGMFLNDAYLPEEELCLAEIFKNNGYNTGYIGKWHLDGHGRLDFTPQERRQGFDYWKALECSHDYNEMPYYEGDSPEVKYWEGYSPFAVSEDAQAYISSQAGSDKPFFLYVSIATPHFPLQSAPQEFKDMYPDSLMKVAPNVPEKMFARVQHDLAGYYAHCTATDQAIGKLLEKIRDLDLMNNTIIVFTSDHGEIMGAHGMPPTQKQVPWIESAGVPLIIHDPTQGMVSRTIEMPLTTPDISATMVGLAGLKIPASFEGTNLTRVIRGGKEKPDHGALYMSVSSFASIPRESKKEYRALKTKDYTYVKSLDGAWLLYNDREDPYQMNNLVSDPESASIQKKLDAQLMSSLKNIHDDFRPAASHLSEWGYQADRSGALPYQAHDQKPQSPKRKH